MRFKILIVTGFGVALSASAGAQTPRPWLHVQVNEGARSKVNVNLPLSLVQVALASAPDTVVKDGHFQFHGSEGSRLSVADMRKLWKELKDAGDTDFVSVEEEDETVNVSRKGDLVMIRTQKTGSKEAVRVDVPVSLVDVMLSGEGDQVDLQKAFAELAKRRGDVVNVTDDDSTVRVWIDERN
jgi:hypothetical protein